MKLIVAIIRPDRLNEVLEALYRREVRGLTVSRVLGHGGETERVETYRGTTVKVDLQEKARLEIGVSEPFVQPTVDAILASGGVIAAPYKADDVGEYPWFAVSNSPRQDDMLVGDEIVACAIEQLGIDPRRIHATGMSAGGLQTVAYSMARSRYIASSASFSGGEYVELPFEDPDNHFAAMIIHGGDNDLFGGFVNFKALSMVWYNQLIDNGNFAFVCDHGGGHTIPAGYGDDVANFFFAHPFGTEPSPYAEGLPENIPSACSL